MERPKHHLQFLDHIRGVAILVVFFLHCLGPSFGQYQLPWGPWFREFGGSKAFLALLPFTYGRAGVAMFFVVSGFCIHLSFLGRNSNWKWRDFYVRRFFRIYPPYLVALLFFALVFPPTRLSFSSQNDWLQLGSHLLLLHNLDERFYYGINPSFWSIAVEAQLYLIYPLLIILVNKIGWKRTLIVTGCLEIILRALVGIVPMFSGVEVPRWISDSPLCFWFSWSIGAALAQAWVKKRVLPLVSTSAPLWFLLAIVSWLIKPLAAFSFLFFALFTATVIAKFLKREEWTPFQTPLFAHLRILGVWSYSFYLLHQPLVDTVPRVMAKLNVALHPLGLFLLCLCTYPLILLLSRLFHKGCELPGVALGKLFLSKTPAQAPR